MDAQVGDELQWGGDGGSGLVWEVEGCAGVEESMGAWGESVRAVSASISRFSLPFYYQLQLSGLRY